MSLVIREACEREHEDVARVLALAFERHRPPPGKDPGLTRAFERYFEEIIDVGARARGHAALLFVAVDDTGIVGTGTLFPPGHGGAAPHARPWPDAWASLRLLAVHPAHHGRGIGRMLLHARVERARELGAPFVALHTSFGAARHLIQSLGWERCAEFDHEPAPGVCAEAYVRALG